MEILLGFLYAASVLIPVLWEVRLDGDADCHCLFDSADFGTGQKALKPVL